MVLGLAAGALGAAGGGGGLSTSSSAQASGKSESGRQVINVGGQPLNLGAIVSAVQGPSRSGAIPIDEPTGLGLSPSNQNAGFNVALPGIDAGISFSPIVIAVGVAAVLLLPRLIKK